MKSPRFILGIALVSLLAAAAVLWAAEPVASVGADEAWARLEVGNRRFATARISAGKPVAVRRAETAQGQHPFAIVVACSDSRTSPELVFDQNLGDLFVVRTAGNLAGDHALGSIEYAVEHLGARLIVVLGHERCGAVTAALAGSTAPGHVNSLVRDIQPAVQATKGKSGNLLDLTIKENARLVAARIRTLAELGELAKSVKIVSGVYDLDTGLVEWSEGRPPLPAALAATPPAHPSAHAPAAAAHAPAPVDGHAPAPAEHPTTAAPAAPHSPAPAPTDSHAPTPAEHPPTPAPAAPHSLAPTEHEPAPAPAH